MSGNEADRRAFGRRLFGGSALVIAVTALLVVPAKIGAFPIPWPLALIWAAYGWSGMGPTVRAALALFLLGLWQDALTGGPKGAWVLVAFAAYAAALAQRRWVAFEGRAATFAGCGLAAIAAGLIGALLSLSRGDGGVPGLFFAQLAVTVMMFPLISGWFATEDDEDGA